MEDTLVRASVELLLPKILSLATDRIASLFGFQKEIASLKESVAMIQAVLADAEKKQKQLESVKLWLKKIEGVAYEADNVLDRLNYELLWRRVKTSKSPLKDKVYSSLSSSRTFILRRKMTPKVRKINSKLKSINEEANGFRLQPLQLVPDPEVNVSRETDSVANQNVVGRANATSNIVKKLLSPSAEVVSFIPITGMGSLGKTTFVRLIYNDPQIDNYFDRKIWVCVSNGFDITGVFKSILESLWRKNVDIVSRDAIVQEIKKELEGKKYLLVLDDVWCNSSTTWDDFSRSLVGISTVKGNWSLVTTRLLQVASIVTASPPFALEKLSNDDCWTILKEKAFPRGEAPEELNEIREEITGACQGLPLVASVIGGLLYIYAKEEWLSIVRNEIPNISGERDSDLRILKLSFDHLPFASIKKCFAYCSLFRKGSDMEKEPLIQLWMAEGFLQPKLGNEIEMEAIGRIYFDILVKSSLFEEVTNENDIKCGRMHNRVHDLSQLVSESETINLEQGMRNDNSGFRYLLLKSLPVGTCKMSKEKSRLLRTVIVEWRIPHDMLLRFKFVRALDLSRVENYKELPNSISKLKCIRYLDLSYSKIKSLPESLCELYNLQTLRILHCYLLRKLPRGMSNLISLRHLHYDFWEGSQMPLKMGKLTSLQTLECFTVGQEKGSRIDEVGKLMNLRGRLILRNLGLVKRKEDAEMANLREKDKLVDLTFEWGRYRKGDNNDGNVFEGLQPHPDVQKLEVCNFMGSRFPSWLCIELNKLVQLRLIDCKRCEEIPALGQLPLLMTLELRGLDRVRCIGRSFYGVDNCSRFRDRSNSGQVSKKLFPALRSLELSRLPNLVSWNGVETMLAQREALEVFDNLEKLTVKDCYGFTSTPTHFPSLKELQITNVGSGTDWLLGICSEVTTLLTLEIHSTDILACIPDEVFRHNQNLVSLILGNCSSLRHLRSCSPSLERLSIFDCKNLEELHIYRSFKDLEIRECPNLKFVVIPRNQHLRSSLQSLRISFCDKLRSLPGELIQSCTSLKSLKVSSCSNLVSFPFDLVQTPSLLSLELYDCPKLTTLPKGFGSCSNLSTLVIGPFSHSVEFDWLTLYSSTVHQLSLYGQHSVSLPIQLHYLTSITILSLEGFGSIESLPDWFRNLQSLEELRLVHCQKLRYLPSKEAMRRLTCLQSLSIQYCPLLSKRCTPTSRTNLLKKIKGSRTDSEWSKISHIPTIIVDYLTIQSGSS